MAFLDNVQWKAYHEASDLPEADEFYVKRMAVYHEAVLADKI
jgi:hypothetical protein